MKNQTFSVSFSGGEVYLHRHDPINPEITLMTFALSKLETIIMLATLMDDPECRNAVLSELIDRGQCIRSENN